MIFTAFSFLLLGWVDDDEPFKTKLGLSFLMLLDRLLVLLFLEMKAAKELPRKRFYIVCMFMYSHLLNMSFVTMR